MNRTYEGWCTMLLFGILCLSFNTSTFAQLQSLPPHLQCGIDNGHEIHVKFPVHPVYTDENEGRSPGNEFWSATTGYGGCPNTCGENTFSCCYDTPTKNYEIPIVFTLLHNDNCNGNSMTIEDIDAFLVKCNSFYECKGIPFTLVKSKYWDESTINYIGNPTSRMADGSTRSICNSDYNNFYMSGSNDVAPKDPFGNGTEDFREVKSFNIPNVMNIYIPGNFNGYTGINFISEGGVASFPSESLDSYALAFGIDGLNNSITDCNGNDIGSTVAIHEVGHWLGLVHTHGFVNNFQVNENDPNLNYWAECPDGSECCSYGDFLCDTDPDPNLNTSSVRDSEGNLITTCVTLGDNCTYDVSQCFSSCGTPYNATLNVNNNMMSYGGCNRYDFTQCQIAKMIDGLYNARSNLIDCDPNFADTNDASLYLENDVIVVCLGDEIPILEITKFGGQNIPSLDPSLIAWYTTSNNVEDFKPIGVGATYDPNLSIDSNVPGEYSLYFDDDITKYSTTPCDDQMRKIVKIIISPEVGSARIDNRSNYIPENCIGENAVTLTATSSNLLNTQTLGWWLTENSDIANTLNSAQNIEAVIAQSELNGTITNPVDVIFKSDSKGSQHSKEINIDCSKLNSNTIYATPFIANEKQAGQSINCEHSKTGQLSSFNNSWPLQWIKFTSDALMMCAPSDDNGCPEISLEINVDGFENTGNDLAIEFRNDDDLSLIMTRDISDSGIHNFNTNDFPSCYNPLSEGLYILIFEKENGQAASSFLFEAEMKISYPGTAAQPFPSFDTIDDCFFGEPVAIHCECTTCPTTTSGSTFEKICSGQPIIPTGIELVNNSGLGVTWSAGGDPLKGILIEDFETDADPCNIVDIQFIPYILCDHDNNPGTAQEWKQVLTQADGYSISHRVLIYPNPDNYAINILPSTECGKEPLIINSVCPTISGQGWVSGTPMDGNSFDGNNNTDPVDGVYYWIHNPPSFANESPNGCLYLNQSGQVTINGCETVMNCPEFKPADANISVCHGENIVIPNVVSGFELMDPAYDPADLRWTFNSIEPAADGSNLVNAVLLTNENCELRNETFYAWYPCINENVTRYLQAGTIAFEISPNPENFRIVIDHDGQCGTEPTILKSKCSEIKEGWLQDGPIEGISTDEDPSNDPQSDIYFWDHELPNFLIDQNCGIENQSGQLEVVGCEIESGEAGNCDIETLAQGGEKLCHNDTPDLSNDATQFSSSSGSSDELVWTFNESPPHGIGANVYKNIPIPNNQCEVRTYVFTAWLNCGIDENGEDNYAYAGSFEVEVYPNTENYKIQITESTTCGEPPLVENSKCPTLSSLGYAENGPTDGCQFDDDTDNDPQDDIYSWSQLLPAFTNDPPASCTYEKNDGFVVVSGCSFLTLSAGSDNSVEVCNQRQDEKIDLIENLNGEPIDIGTWSEESEVPSGVDISNPFEVSFYNVSIGVYTFKYTLTSSNGCISSSFLEITVSDCVNPYVVNDDDNETQLSEERESIKGDSDNSDALFQNYPNPFKDYASISFSVQKTKFVSFSFYNLNGKLLHKIVGHYPEGINTLKVESSWFGQSGVIYYHMETDNFRESKKMMVLD